MSHITASSFVGFAADRLLDEPRLRPVRQARRVQRDAADVDALARAVVAVDVVHDLLRLHVGVVVREHDRLVVPVEHPRAERADHEVRALERLVRGRRLVQPPRLGLEVGMLNVYG